MAFEADLKRDTAKWQPRHQRVFEQSSPEFVALFSKTEALLDRLNALPDEPRQAQIRKLGVLLGDPRSERPRLARAADETLRSAAATAADKARAKADLEAIEDASLLEGFFKQSRLGVKLADSRKVWEELAEVNAREARGWIRTAAVVASRDTVQLDAVGGHSIDAAMTALKMDESLPTGVVRAVRGERGQVTINYSPADRARIGVISRKVSEFNPGTTIVEAETQLSAAVRNAPATARPLATVLGQGGGPSPLPDHLLAQRSVEQRLRVVAPWPPQAQEFASRYRPTLLVRSSNDHFEVLSSETGEASCWRHPRRCAKCWSIMRVPAPCRPAACASCWTAFRKASAAR